MANIIMFLTYVLDKPDILYSTPIACTIYIITHNYFFPVESPPQKNGWIYTLNLYKDCQIQLSKSLPDLANISIERVKYFYALYNTWSYWSERVGFFKGHTMVPVLSTLITLYRFLLFHKIHACIFNKMQHN